jgi:type VI secretion system protein ImpA
MALDALARGKPEQAIGEEVIGGEEPRWPDVTDACLALLERTRDIRVAAHLHAALLRGDGLKALPQGLGLIRQMLENFWATVHPQLDAEDDDDPTMRLNALAALVDEERALRFLRAAPIVSVRGIGDFSLRDWRVASGAIRLAEDSTEERTELALIEAAFLEAPIEALKETAGAVDLAAEELTGITTVLDREISGSSVDLKPLVTDLNDLKDILAEYLSRRGVIEAVESADGGDDAGAALQKERISGTISSRGDVVRAIDLICEYYARHEPSSPLPILLRRAKRLVDKDFMAIVRDLTPAGMSEAQSIAGTEDDQ